MLCATLFSEHYAACRAQAGDSSELATDVLYCLNESGRISRSDPIEADSDEQALQNAQALARDADGELWLHDRRIGRLPATWTQWASGGIEPLSFVGPMRIFLETTLTASHESLR
jgi:hypothetical protein